MDLSKLGQLDPKNGFFGSQFNYVSIDELTEFCSVQLQACDKQIRSLTTNQQGIVNNAEAIANAQAALNDLAATIGKEGGQTLSQGASSFDAARAKLKETIATLQGLEANSTDPASYAIKKELDALVGKCQMDYSQKPAEIISITADLGQDETADMAKDLQGVADKLQSDQSMNMIKVQSAVGQREQMVQLVTGLIQKMNEMVSSVVNNIGK